MLYLLLGSLSFLLFIIYDYNNITYEHKVIKHFFALGSIILIYSTFSLILIDEAIFQLPRLIKMFVIFITFCSAVLLIYTLFFALPFNKTYINPKASNQVNNQGMYALCRHPGVLWFGILYFMLWLSTAKILILWAGLLFSSLNIIYVWFQDRFIFIKQFDNYKEYQANTPFLIPNKISFNKSIEGLKNL